MIMGWSTKTSTLVHLQESYMATWSSINKPKCVFGVIQNVMNDFLRNFLKIFYFSEFLLPYSLDHSLIPWKLATATASLLWRKWLEFHGEKTFHKIECLHVCASLLQFCLWSFFMVAIASQYGCPQRSSAVSHIASGFPHHVIMRPNTLRYSWCYSSCLANSFYLRFVTGNPKSRFWSFLKGGVTHSIRKFNVRAVQQLFLMNLQTIWE